MAISSPDRGAIFVAPEATYGVAPTLTSDHYVLTGGGGVTDAPYNFRVLPERSPGDDQRGSVPGRSSTSCSLTALIRGAPNGHDAPDLDDVLAALFGADAVEVAAVADTTSGGGLGKVLGVVDGARGEAGKGLLKPVIGAAGGATATVDLAGTPSYGSRNYNFGGPLRSLTMRDQPSEGGSVADAGLPAGGAPARVATGWVPSALTITLDSTTEATAAFEGPARGATQGAAAGADIAVPALPGEEALPQSSDEGTLWYQDLSQSSPAWVEMSAGIRSGSIVINNNIALRNDESGSTLAAGAYRGARRSVEVRIGTYAEEGNGLWQAIRTGNGPYFAVIYSWGTVEGARACVYLPRVRFGLPNAEGGDQALGWNFSGMAFAGSGALNDSVALLLG